MPASTIQIGIVDDHSLFRKALRNLLGSVPDFQVALDATDGDDLLQKLNSRNHLDVLLLDLSMPRLDGRETLRLLHNRFPHIKVVILSMGSDPQVVSELLNYGIYGYIPKEADVSELLEAIKGAAAGKLYQNKVLTEALYWRTTHTSQQAVGESAFINEKQRKILQLLWQEKSTQEIASEVFLSVSAVDKIKQQLKEKTGAKTTVGLIKFGISKSIIPVTTISY
jgi:DNA-binding NarL/FixJ family response regulator